jgi:hypothetical protein
MLQIEKFFLKKKKEIGVNREKRKVNRYPECKQKRNKDVASDTKRVPFEHKRAGLTFS